MLFLFVDGVGLGPARSDNPLSVARMPTTIELLGGRRLVLPASGQIEPPLYGLDATLGVPGLPQSGTGQTALLTGFNAARLLGRHRGPYPGVRLHPILKSHSLWSRLGGEFRMALANAYPDGYLQRVRRGTGRMGAIARSAHLAGVRLRGPEDLRRRCAASAFLTNEVWRDRLGYQDMAVISEEEAGEAVATAARNQHFTAFEYYATDLAGHRGDLPAAVEALESFDRFLAGALRVLPPRVAVVLASDHGNIEDLSTRHHTLNPAICVWHGSPPNRELKSLTDLAPAIQEHILASQDLCQASTLPRRGGSSRPSG